jgi:tRNA (guanine-N7-)-methyltransferase
VAGKNKLRRFAENLTFDNLFQLNYEELKDGFHLKGSWNDEYFNTSGDIVLELGCGKGEYTTGLAERYPEKNFIGVDIKGSRLYVGLKYARDHDLSNVAFIRTRINLIEYCFAKDEISEIWITFPDPQPRRSRTRRRLTSPRFLENYTRFLKPDGIIHLKTDNIIVYEATLDVIREGEHELLFSSDDIYASGIDNELTQIQTFYERKWLNHGTRIKYLQFRLKRDEGE